MLVSAKTKSMLRIAGAIIGFWALSVHASESIYKWVDEDGSVHFSDHPPPEVNKSEKLRIESAPSDAVVRAAQQKRDSLRTTQLSSHDQRTAERERNRLQAELVQTRQDGRQRRCMKAHEEIQSLDHHMPIYYIDETGNRVFLDDNKRANLIEFYHRETKMFCE